MSEPLISATSNADSSPTNATPIQVLLADDHDILRQGLKLLLSMQQDMLVVGEARTGREALALTLTLAPDVVVMDITMPDMDGLEACRLIRAQQSTTQVLILTMHESEEYFLQALRMGAAGYLVKEGRAHRTADGDSRYSSRWGLPLSRAGKGAEFRPISRDPQRRPATVQLIRLHRVRRSLHHHGS